MANKDIYDESYIPQCLRVTGKAVYKFKQFLNESDLKRKPQIDSFMDTKGLIWSTKCRFIEPKEMVFEAKGKRKKDSEAIAMAKALMWLRDNHLVDNSFDVIKITQTQVKDFYDSIGAPIVVKPIDECLKNDMKKFCDQFDHKLKDRLIEIRRNCRQKTLNSNDLDSGVNANHLEVNNEIQSMDSSDDSIIRNVFTNTVYKEPTNESLIEREVKLKLFLKQRIKRVETDQSFAKLRQKVGELPINRFREEILEMIEQNRVIVISGDTGCGKTTQVPQMIFENEINSQRGAFVNIVVTQPRRLSTIAISKRIAKEFGEEVIGNSIGYNIRFDKTLPKHPNGAVLFCSTGVLLRKLESNASLKGVSHVIIDEVHERDVIIDFLLVLLKRVLNLNPNIRIILMSASMNANLFVEYFGCPLIEIPGRCYAIKHYYLNEFCGKIGINDLENRFSANNPKLDAEMTTNLINYIDRNRGDGAILCFLPGWAEIQTVMNLLEEQNTDHFLIAPVHSRLALSAQNKIFAETAAGVRKVILSTNIAETSLTIDDVVYVIDSGLAKEMRYNSRLNVSNFGTNWISRANAKQRSGRAGRVQEGECYRLYTRQIENTFMSDFPIPELLRIPLENVVMQAKLHCPHELVPQFLSQVPQPPTASAINTAIDLLREIKVLDDKEGLTALGKRIITFTTHPRLSVALVYSTFFRCVKSMLPLVAQLSANREPFQVLPDEKHLIRKIKSNYSYDIISDHIPLVDLTLEYQQMSEENNLRELSAFRVNNHLHRYSMDSLLETVRQFATHLQNSNFISGNEWNDPKSYHNCNWHRKHVLISTLVPALVPNFVRLMRGDVRNRKIKLNTLSAFDVKTNSRAKFVAESIFNTNFHVSDQLELLSNSILVYFGSFFSEEAQMMTICDASVVSPISLLLFCDKNFEFNFDYNLMRNVSKDECIVVLHKSKHLSFQLKREDMQLIGRWNDVFNIFFDWFLIPKHVIDSDIEELDKINDYLQDFIQLTDHLLNDKY